MKELILDPSGSRRDTIESLAIFKDRHGSNFKAFSDGAHYMKLVADLSNTYYHRAVIAYVDGLPVGYLYNDLAKYYQPQIIRLNAAGFELMVRCKVFAQYHHVNFRPLSKGELLRWTNIQLGIESNPIKTWGAVSALAPESRKNLQKKMSPHILWLASRTWFDTVDAKFIEPLCYGLLHYTSKGGQLYQKELTRQNEITLLAIAYALHRISADDGICYRGKTNIGNDISGKSVRSRYIGLQYDDYFRLALEYPEFHNEIAVLILKDGDEATHGRIRWKLKSELGLIDKYRKNIFL